MTTNPRSEEQPAQLLTMKEFCRMTRMSPSTVYRLRKNGFGPPIVGLGPTGRGIRIVSSLVPAWLAALRRRD